MITLIKLFLKWLTETLYEFKKDCLDILINKLPEYKEPQNFIQKYLNDLKLKLLKYQITFIFSHEFDYVDFMINISECEEDLLEMKNHYQSKLINTQNNEFGLKEVYIEQWEYLLEMINERIAEFA